MISSIDRISYCIHLYVYMFKLGVISKDVSFSMLHDQNSSLTICNHPVKSNL